MIQSIPKSRSKRWQFVRQLTQDLFPKRKPSSKFSPSSIETAELSRGAAFPQSVREWYALIDEIGDYWSGQDRMWPPETAEVEGGYWILMIENQGCFRMGHRHSDDQKTDPPIYRFHDGNYRLSPSVSVFAIQMLLMESIFHGKHLFFDGGGIDNKIAKSIERKFRKSELPDFPLWTGPTRFVCDDDIVIRLDYPDGLRGDAFIGFCASTKSGYKSTIKLLTDLGVDTEQ